MHDEKTVPASEGAALNDPELQPGTEIAGYVVEAKIGQGGMGTVYGAHHPRIGKKVAIKVLARSYCNDSSAVARFEQEARLVNEIRHPNIVDVFQFGELPDKRSFFIMERLTGETLSERIAKGRLETGEMLDILDSVCDALEAAHEHGVVHRDLKSDNVFLAMNRGKRTVKLLDFGVAKLGRNDLSSVGSTASGLIVGTPAYMSPEQARAQPVSPRTDVYQLGILAYKMSTGELPFVADNPMDLIFEQLRTPAPSPKKLAPKLPDGLARLIVRMMEKAPEARPTVPELRRAFADLRDPQKAAQVAAEPKKKPPPKRRATSILTAVTVFLVGFVSLTLFLYVRDRKTEEPEPQAAPVASPSTPPPAPLPSPTPTKSPEPEIEMEPVVSASPSASPSPSPSKHHSKKKEEEEEVVAPPIPTNRPGAILFTLKLASDITIDGKTVAQSSKGGRFEVPPGNHEVTVKAPGYQAVSRSVEVVPGGVAIISTDDAAP